MSLWDDSSGGSAQDGRTTFEALMESEVPEKRARSDSESSSDLAHKRIAHDVKQIVFVHSEQVNIAKVNPLIINRDLQDIVGQPEKVVLLRDCIKLWCTNSQYNLLKQKRKLCGYLVKYKTQNVPQPVVKGIVHGVHTEIVENDFIAANHRVVKAERLTRYNRSTKQKDPTGSVVLSFRGDCLPDKVYLGFQSFNVNEFVPRPMRCYKCQRYGHVANNCRGSVRCPKCGGSHGYDQCSKESPSCLHCGGDHSVAFTGCPKYKEAKEVQTFRIKNKVSYAQAVKAVCTKPVVPIQQHHSEVQVSSVPDSVVEMSSVSDSVVEVSSQSQADQKVLSQPTQESSKKMFSQVVAFVAKIVAVAQDSAFWQKYDRKSRITFITDLASSIFDIDLDSDSVLEKYQSAPTSHSS